MNNQNTMLMNNSQKYRPDIDGLRAVAVLAVVFFHVSKNTIKGGFVGVDVFFVISGFLITGILVKSFTNQNVIGSPVLSVTHQIISFYARRVRRIFPVLIIVLLSCILAGWLLLTPDEFLLLGKHIAGGAVYISNYILWKEVGYFDVSSDVKPLLHLWSLGIEEQFYIVWPFFILVLLKLKLRLETFLSLFVIASFACNISMIRYHATETFYSPITRFWELAIGGVLASFYYRKSPIWNQIAFKLGVFFNRFVYSAPKYGNEVQISKDILSILGLFLILVSIFLFNSEMQFPGKKALIPTLGAFFLIAAGESAFVNKKILSLNIFVFIGIISYPLYLWHWPLLSFARILYGDVPPILVRLELVLLAFLLSWITFRFIEPPLRWGNHSRIKAICLLVLLLVIGAAGLYIQNNNGIPSRQKISAEDVQTEIYMYKQLADSNKLCQQYFPHWALSDWTDQSCAFTRNPEELDIAVIGDSYAEHLFFGLAQKKFHSQHGIAVFPASCNLPYLDLTSGITDGPTYYRKKSHLLHREAFDFIFKHKKIRTVVLAHNPQCSFDALYDNRNINQNDKDKILSDGVRRTFDALKKNHKRVVIVWNNPFFPRLPQDVCREANLPVNFYLSEGGKCRIPRKEVDENAAYLWYSSIVKNVAKDYDNIFFYDSKQNFCNNEFCSMKQGNKIVYKDLGHLNIWGSILVANDLMKLIDEIEQ